MIQFFGIKKKKGIYLSVYDKFVLIRDESWYAIPAL